MTLQFRALLIDPGDTTQERPVQIFGSSRGEIDRWAEQVLAKAKSPTANVTIYQTSEVKIATVWKGQAKSAGGTS